MRSARLGLALITLAVTTIGCGSSQEDQSSDLYSRFHTGDGYLYPPELWGALGVSVESKLRHDQAMAAIGQPSNDALPIAATYDQLRMELQDDLAAAAMLSETGVVDGTDAPWTVAEADQWFEGAVAARNLDSLLLAADVATTDAQSRQIDQAGVDWLATVIAGKELVPALQADLILREFAGSDTTRAPSDITATELRSARDAAWLLFHAVTIESTDPEDVDDAAVDVAVDAALTDDYIYSLVVRAYASAGDTDRALEIAGLFDERRLLANGDVLEPIIFGGTTGSTFRMVRYLDTADRLDSDVLPAESTTIERTAIDALTNSDTSVRLASMATAVILSPESVDPAERSAAVTSALEEEGISTDPLSLETALAWFSIAEYAAELDVPITFPGINSEGIAALQVEAPEVVAPLLARFLKVISESQQPDAVGVDSLVELLESYLSSTPAIDLDSSTLFAGADAIHELQGTWVFTPEELTQQFEARTGDCLGGFSDFVRDLPTPNSTCNVEATRYALPFAPE